MAIVVVVDETPAIEVVGGFGPHGVGERTDMAGLYGNGQSVVHSSRRSGGGNDDVIGAGSVPSGCDGAARCRGGDGTCEGPAIGGPCGTCSGEGVGNILSYFGWTCDDHGGCWGCEG